MNFKYTPAFVFVVVVLSASAAGLSAQPKSPKRPKIPHSHHSSHGGAVLMFGDDHVEIAKDATGKKLHVYFSDKLRDPLKPADFNHALSLVDGGRVTALVTSAKSDAPFELQANLPNQFSPTAELEVKAQRLNARSGYVVSDRSQKIALSKLPILEKKNTSSHEHH